MGSGLTARASCSNLQTSTERRRGANGNLQYTAAGCPTLVTTSDVGQGGSDTITTGAGVDLIFGGSAGDLVHAGAGNDMIVGDNGYAAYNAAGVLVTLTTTDDTVGGNDTIYGGSAGDWIAGGSGDDTILGQRGVDLIYGDSGFNVNVITRVLDIVNSNTSTKPNADLLTAGADLLYGEGTGATSSTTADDFADVIFGDKGEVFQDVLGARATTRVQSGMPRIHEFTRSWRLRQSICAISCAWIRKKSSNACARRLPTRALFVMMSSFHLKTPGVASQNSFIW